MVRARLPTMRLLRIALSCVPLTATVRLATAQHGREWLNGRRYLGQTAPILFPEDR